MTLPIRTVSDQVTDEVRARILTGKVKPDAPLRQQVLAEELGVSKIPLREALARLEQDGLLTSHPNRGFFVRPMTTDELEEIYALRLKLEPEAVALGALKAQPADHERAAAALAVSEGAAGSRELNGGAQNRTFHLSLIRPGDQRVTTEILERLHILSDRYVCKHLEPLGRNARADLEHRTLLEAWLARDAARVEALVRLHIASTLDDLRRQLS